MSDKIIDQVKKIKVPAEELEILAQLSTTAYFVILKRVARRYAISIKDRMAFLDAKDPNMPLLHAELKFEMVGMDRLLSIIAGAEKKLSEIENNT